MMNEDMVVRMIVMKRVVHLGPSESKGGMATVMENMVQNVPEGWSDPHYAFTRIFYKV